MFICNKIVYSVQSTFIGSLRDYTTEINADASDFR